MARPKTMSSENYDKLSMNIMKETKAQLEDGAKSFNMKTGPFTNFVLDSLFAACKNEIVAKTLCDTLEKHGDEARKQHTPNAALAAIIRKISGIGEGMYKAPDTCNEIQLENAIAIIPKDRIIINPEDASASSHAAVITCRNNKQYGFPYLVVFFNPVSSDCTNDSVQNGSALERRLVAQAKVKFPQLEEILKQQVSLPTDPAADMTAYIAAPNIICTVLPAVPKYIYTPMAYPQGALIK